MESRRRREWRRRPRHTPRRAAGHAPESRRAIARSPQSRMAAARGRTRTRTRTGSTGCGAQSFSRHRRMVGCPAAERGESVMQQAARWSWPCQDPSVHTDGAHRLSHLCSPWHALPPPPPFSLPEPLYKKRRRGTAPILWRGAARGGVHRVPRALAVALSVSEWVWMSHGHAAWRVCGGVCACAHRRGVLRNVVLFYNNII